MATTIAVRHVSFEDLGMLAPLLEHRGHEIRYLDAGVDPIPPAALDDADLVVVLGAPVGVGDGAVYPFLAEESRAIASRLETGRPLLGICLGAQLIAHALGAAVTPTGRHEIGYAPVSLTAAGEGSVLAELGETPVLHWHGDEFAIPASAERLALTPGFPNQAFRIGRTTLGLQFHLEADHRQIERWLIGHAHELWASGVDPRTVRADAERHGDALLAVAQRVFTRWLDELPAR